MLLALIRRSAVTAIAALIALALLPRIASAAEPVNDHKSHIGPKEGLTPCLAIHADGSPVWASTTFPPMKRITVAFRLKADESGKQLKSKWKRLGETENIVAENALELQGQKSGFLRLVLKQPAPPGKYRLETMLDDRPWESIDLTVAEAIKDGVAQKPDDLVPLAEGQKLAYDMSLVTGPGTSMEVPGVTMGPDGSAAAKIEMVVGASDASAGGTLYTMNVNGKPTRTLLVKKDAKGLIALKSKEGDTFKDMDSQYVIQPIPPSLENESEWKTPGRQGGDQKFQFFGPLTVQGPAGATTGYVLFSDEPITAGALGREAIRGRETVEQHLVPRIGLVREVRVATLGGRLSSRQETTLTGVGKGDTGGIASAAQNAGAAPGALASDTPNAAASRSAPAGAAAAGGQRYRLEPDATMKGRLGRVKFDFPAGTKASETHVAVFKAGEKKEAASGYGKQSFEVLPGKYEVEINKKRVAVEVKSATNTMPIVGVLRVHAGKDTHVKVLDTDKKTQLFAGYGDADVPLPVGDYIIEISGAQEPVKIEDGKIVEF